MVEYTPSKDASLGLILRLNYLWTVVDNFSMKEGHRYYKNWDVSLDTIYRSLLFRNKMKIQKDKNGNVLKVNLSREDTQIHKILSKNINECRINFNKRPTVRTRASWYNAISKKDVWIRKLMMDLRLYLKQIKESPGTALFGGKE